MSNSNLKRQTTTQAPLTKKLTQTRPLGRSSTGIKQSTIEEEDYSFDGEDDKTVKSYGKDPFAKSKAEMSPPTRQRATDAKGESGLKSMSPAKKVLFRDPTEEAESELNGKINKMNSDLAHLNDQHYDQRTMKARKKHPSHFGVNTPADKLEMLQDENTALKTRQRALEQQVKLISTKLQRQIGIINSERFAGKNKITAQFERNLDELIRENTELQEQEGQLMEKVRKLQAKRKKELKEGKQLYSVATQGGERKRIAKHEQDQRHVITALRDALDQSHKELVSLAKQVEAGKRHSGDDINLEALQREKHEMEHKVIQARSRLEDVKANLKVRDDIFKDGKYYEQSLLDSLREAHRERSELEDQKRLMETQIATNAEIKDRIDSVRKERDMLQEKLSQVTRQPFFNREKDAGNLAQLDQLSAKLEEATNKFNDDTAMIHKHQKEIQALDEESGKTAEKISFFKEQIQRMKMHMDPSSLTIGDIMKKLKTEDEARFREVMEDLSYEGKDPNWLNLGIMDQLNAIKGFEAGQRDDAVNLNKVKERLLADKKELVSELVRTQGLLQATVNIDKEQTALKQEELSQLQLKIKAAYAESATLNDQIKDRNRQLITLQERFVPHGLTSADLARFNNQMTTLKREVKEDDAMTEFSAITDETEIGPVENLLDLRISTASFDRSALVQLLGSKDIAPSQIQTFLAVDFFNHDTKTTDLSTSEAPVFNTLFTFKNTVDDFYLKHLATDTILVDVFLSSPPSQASQGPKTIKIGSARLPLNKLLEKDYSFQAQEIVNESQGRSVKIGRLFYRMRMRKDLTEAQKWQQQRSIVAVKRDPRSEGQGSRKVVEIIIKQAYNLTIHGQAGISSRMLPFFSYRFYSFEDVMSPNVQGNNPFFEHRKQFEVEDTSEFRSFMGSQVLKIDFMDESVDLRQKHLTDYIGSLRIPLKTLLDRKQYVARVPIEDDMKRKAGECDVSLKLQDASDFYAEKSRAPADLVQSNMIMKDVIDRIALRMAECNFDDFDLLLNLLFAKEAGSHQGVSRLQFKDFLLNDIKVPYLTDEQLNIFLKTHPILSRQERYTREDLKAVLESQFKKALMGQIEIEAHSTTRYGGATRPLQVPKSNNFGMSMSPAKATNPFRTMRGGDSHSGDADFERDASATQSNRIDDQQPGHCAHAHIPGLPSSLTDKIFDYMTKNVYAVIDQFQIEVGGSLINEAQPHHTVNVLRKCKIADLSDAQAKLFHESLCDKNGVCYFREALIAKYHQKPQVDLVAAAISPESKKQLAAIHSKIYQYLKSNNNSLEDFYAIVDKDKSKNMDLTEFISGTKFLLNENEATLLFRTADTKNEQKINVQNLIFSLVTVRAARALEAIETEFIKEAGTGDAASKLMAKFDKNKSGSIDIIEFGKMLEVYWKQLPRQELDQIFNAIDRNNRGELTEQDIRNAFANKESSLVEPQFIEPEDLMLAYFTKAVRRYRKTPEQLWNQFAKLNKIAISELQEMLLFELQVKLTPDEVQVMKTYLGDHGGSLTKSSFLKLMSDLSTSQRPSRKLNELVVQNAMLKVAASFHNQAKRLKTEIEAFQTWQEKSKAEIIRRNFKHFLAVNGQLSPYELGCCVHYFDMDYDGYIQVEDVEKKFPSSTDVQSYLKK